MVSSIAQAIQETLAYADVFSLPLTANEIYQNLWQYSVGDLSELLRALQILVDQGAVCTADGFYVLPGREANIQLRHVRLRLVETKIKRAKRAVKKLLVVPFLRAVFVTNSVAGGTPQKGSDIDIMIVASSGRMWIVRMLVLAILDIFRLRPNARGAADKICVNFLLADDALALGNLRVAEPDIYLAHWILELIPIYDPEHFDVQIRQKNSWIKSYLPNALLTSIDHPRLQVRSNRLQNAIRHFFERAWGGAYGNLINDQAKKIQDYRIHRSYGNALVRADHSVVITDSVMKFHDNDRREYYRDQWRMRLGRRN